jgi:hypothetical protein
VKKTRQALFPGDLASFPKTRHDRRKTDANHFTGNAQPPAKKSSQF